MTTFEVFITLIIIVIFIIMLAIGAMMHSDDHDDYKNIN